MSDNILKQVEDVANVEKDVPVGYVRIRMSTKGKYGAPEFLHIRNFSVEEALELGSIAQDELPIKVTNLLQRIILEKDIDISNFYEQEVAELLIHFYTAFYSSTLKDVAYEVTDTDKEWMKNNVYQGKETDDYKNWERGVETGKVKPQYDIDLNAVEYYIVPENAKQFIKYSNGNFNCVFQYPRFGDTALLQKALKEHFRQQDAQMRPLYEIYKRKQDAEERFRRGENVAIDSIPTLNEDDEKAVRAYELEKTSFIIQNMKGMYLKELMGTDISDRPLSERIEIAKDPRIDFSTYQTVADTFTKLQIGPVPKVKIVNPVTGLLQEIDHPFRTLELLAAIKHYRPDNANIEFI